MFPCPKFPSSQIQLNMTPAQDMLLILPASYTSLLLPFPSSCPSVHTHHEVFVARSGGQASTPAFTLAPGPFMKAAMPTHQELWMAFDPTEWSTWRPVGEVHSCPAPTTLSWEISHKQILCYIIYMCVLSVYICAYIYIYIYIYLYKTIYVSFKNGCSLVW